MTETAENLKQYAYELHRPALKYFERRSVSTLFPNELWAADLTFIREPRKPVKKKRKKNAEPEKPEEPKLIVILNIVDVYSRYAWSFVLPDKKGKTIAEAFKTFKTTPQNLWVDEGSEFYNKDFEAWCRDKNVNMYHTYSGLKSVFVERFNRTMKEYFYKKFTHHQTSDFRHYQEQFLKEYNHTVHSSTEQTPDDVYYHGKIPITKVKTISTKKPKFHVGEYVRVSKVKNLFEKGYTARWSSEVFEIAKINTNQHPFVYELKDLKGEDITGIFYEQEIQRTKIPEFKVIDKVIQKTKKQVLVSYQGYGDKFNKWITEAQYKKYLKDIKNSS